MSEAEVPVRPAATVVLVRDGGGTVEALLVRRNSELVFHGGSWVFPGGRLDPEDVDPARPDDEEWTAQRAAAREAHEEAGLVIDPEGLALFAHWTTPPGRPRRFATWFFLAQAPDRHEVATDGGEISDHAWFSPRAALAARAAREIELPAPTFVTLTWLSSIGSAADAVEWARDHPVVPFHPRPVDVEGGFVSLYPGDVAYDDPSRLGDPGPRHRMWAVEPWRYERSGLDG